MSAQKGSLFVIETGSGTSPITYTKIASARSVDFTVSNSQVDVTTYDSAGWKTLLEGAGVADVGVTVQGVYTNTVSEQTLATAVFANAFQLLKFTNGNSDSFTGSFGISSYKRAGTYNGEETYQVSYVSSGLVTFVAGS